MDYKGSTGEWKYVFIGKPLRASPSRNNAKYTTHLKTLGVVKMAKHLSYQVSSLLRVRDMDDDS
jgi:hypothetical protein